MSPTTTELTIPSLDELRRMTAEPDQRVVIRDVDWSFYERLVDSIPEGANLHVDYDGTDLEVMTLSALNDGQKKLFGQLVEAIAQELEIPYKRAGQTTWKRPGLDRGLESDECYFFDLSKLAMVAAAKARRLTSISDYPNPDLGIEVDISPSLIDRPGIYAALKVKEIWRFDFARSEVVIERLGDDDRYHAIAESRSCQSAPRKCGAGSLTKTRVTSQRGRGDFARGLGPSSRPAGTTRRGNKSAATTPNRGASPASRW